MHSLEL